MSELELLLSEMRNAEYVSRTKDTVVWAWRSLELTIHFDKHDRVRRITGTNRKGE